MWCRVHSGGRPNQCRASGRAPGRGDLPPHATRLCAAPFARAACGTGWSRGSGQACTGSVVCGHQPTAAVHVQEVRDTRLKPTNASFWCGAGGACASPIQVGVSTLSGLLRSEMCEGVLSEGSAQGAPHVGHGGRSSVREEPSRQRIVLRLCGTEHTHPHKDVSGRWSDGRAPDGRMAMPRLTTVLCGLQPSLRSEH